MPDPVTHGIRAAKLGVAVNLGLAATKFTAGVVGHTYALVADAVESTADIFGSLAVWGGLAVAAQPADEDHPFGHGKAEALAALVVGILMVAATIGIAVEAVREIRTPHRAPAPWTLAVLVGVVIIKFALSRSVGAVGATIDSTAVRADAWHHLSDAVTSAAAFVGISIALLAGPGWEAADDWAALLASCVIAYNAMILLRPALHDLMDRMPSDEVVLPLRRAAEGVDGVLAVEKLAARKAGMNYHVTIHVQAEPSMSLHDAHALGGCVKAAIQRTQPSVASVLVHMEPYEEEVGGATWDAGAADRARAQLPPPTSPVA